MRISWVKKVTRTVLVVWLVTVLAACVPTRADPEVHLNDLQPLHTTQLVQAVPLRVAVAAVTSPRGTAESYRPLLDYIADRIGRPVVLVQRRTYAEVNDLIQAGLVDLAFVCTSAYVEGRDSFGMELLAAPQVDGRTVYYSVLIVPADSSARSMRDLRGKVFAFTDPMSLSGRVYPSSVVRAQGSTPEQYFARTYFTYSHDDAIRAVADGVADGAMVDSLVYDFAVAREPELAARTRLIARSPPFGIPPVVVGPDVRPQVKAELRNLLLALADDADPRAAQALRSIGVERFVTIEDGAYASVRDLLKRLQPAAAADVAP